MKADSFMLSAGFPLQVKKLSLLGRWRTLKPDYLVNKGSTECLLCAQDCKPENSYSLLLVREGLGSETSLSFPGQDFPQAQCLLCPEVPLLGGHQPCPPVLPLRGTAGVTPPQTPSGAKPSLQVQQPPPDVAL